MGICPMDSMGFYNLQFCKGSRRGGGQNSGRQIRGLTVAALLATAHLLGQGQLGLALQLPNVLDGESMPFVLPGPGLPVCPEHHFAQRHIMNELLQFGLHAPVAELHAADLVGGHQGHVAGGRLFLALHLPPILLQPVLAEWTASRLVRNEVFGILLLDIIATP